MLLKVEVVGTSTHKGPEDPSDPNVGPVVILFVDWVEVDPSLDKLENENSNGLKHGEDGKGLGVVIELETEHLQAVRVDRPVLDTPEEGYEKDVPGEGGVRQVHQGYQGCQ